MFSDVAAVAKNWWLFVVLGVLCVVTGIVVIVWPDITLVTFGVLAGIYLLFAAVMEIIEAIIGEPGNRALSAILGVITLIAGLVFVRHPGDSLIALVVVAGVFLIATGVLHIVFAFGARGSRLWAIALGIFDVIVGAVILAWPKLGLVTLAVFFAVTMLFRGVIAIVAGFKLRSLRNVDESAQVQQTATFA